MRTLFLTPFPPDPVAPHGGGSYVGMLARAMAELGDVALVCLAEPGTESASHSVPWAWTASAPYEGHPPARGGAAHRLRMLWRWHSRPLLPAKAWSKQLCKLVGRARREYRPDVVLVEFAQMAQYLPWLDGVPTVLTDHEAGWPANAGTGLGRAADRRDRRLWRDYVERHYRQARLLQAVTGEDARALSAWLGRDVLVRPACMALPERSVDPGAAPPRALFFGDYGHAPNPEAAGRLVRDVLPRLLRAEPAAELWLAGRNSERIAHLDGTPGVRVCGFVQDLGGLLAQVRLLLAPMWSGAGFRVKNAAALAHGVPVVTNALGARGGAPPPACTVAEDPEGLAAAAIALLRSPAEASARGRAGREWVRATLSPAAVARLQLERAEALLLGRP